jgi:signal peptidase I
VGSRTGFTDQREYHAAAQTKGVVREYVEVILVCVIFILFARHFVFQQSEIPSGSMEDTILIGDYILVNRWAYAPVSFEWERALLPSREIRRGDIIVFKQPQTPERDYIKRVIGVPGDTLQVTREGQIFVNGELLIEPYINPLYARTKPHPLTKVKPGHYFVMGDHRNLSSDSREWGQTSADLVKGKAFIVLLSTRPRSADGRPSEQVTLRSLGVKMYKLIFHSRWDRALRRIE